MKTVEELLSKFVFNIVSDKVQKDAFKCDGIPSRQIQRYFRELKILDLFMDILIYPFEG